MRVKLAFRKQKMKRVPFTGKLSCGCRLIEGELFEKCDYHFDMWGPVKVGKHAAPPV